MLDEGAVEPSKHQLLLVQAFAQGAFVGKKCLDVRC
jgi:hypothetical protein